MLAALAKTGNVSQAAKAAKIDRRTHQRWRQEDPEYDAATEEAMEEAADLLEAEAQRRAVTGVLEPVYQGGKKVGTIRRTSDTLLIFLLKGARPAKFAERVDMKHTGRVKHDLGLNLSDLSEDDLERLDTIAKKLGGREPGGRPDSG